MIVSATTPPTNEPSGAPLDPAELATWRGFLRVHSALTKELDAELVAEHGLTLSSYEVLLHLATSPSGCARMSDLAGSALLSRSGMTRLVDRLEREGLVRREGVQGRRPRPERRGHARGPAGIRARAAHASLGCARALPRAALGRGAGVAGQAVGAPAPGRHRARSLLAGRPGMPGAVGRTAAARRIAACDRTRSCPGSTSRVKNPVACGAMAARHAEVLDRNAHCSRALATSWSSSTVGTTGRPCRARRTAAPRRARAPPRPGARRMAPHRSPTNRTRGALTP